MCIRDRFSSVAISSDKVVVKMAANKTNQTENTLKNSVTQCTSKQYLIYYKVKSLSLKDTQIGIAQQRQISANNDDVCNKSMHTRTNTIHKYIIIRKYKC